MSSELKKVMDNMDVTDKGTLLSNEQASLLLSGLQEEDVQELVHIFRSSKYPLKTYYFDHDKKRYMLVSYVFHEAAIAKSFKEDLENIFSAIKIQIKEDKDGRTFLHVDPKSIDGDELAKFVGHYSVELFKHSENFYDARSKTQVKFLLDALRATSTPMDSYYWNYRTREYYLMSHVFKDYRRSERYRERFMTHFSSYCVDVLEDATGRSYVVVNPKKIEKDKFDAFIQKYAIKLFEEVSDHHTSKGNEYFSATLDTVQYLLNTFRKTSFPFDTYFYHKDLDHYYLISHVFYNEERANKFIEQLRQIFEKNCVVGRSDEEGRWFVYLNPNAIKKSALKELMKDCDGAAESDDLN